MCKKTPLILIALVLMSFPVLCFGATKDFYFSDYNTNFAWANQPVQMVDGYLESYANTANPAEIEIVRFPIPTDLGDVEATRITKVELNARGYNLGLGASAILITPQYIDLGQGIPQRFALVAGVPTNSPWFDITNDLNAPSNWTWNDIKNLEMIVEAAPLGGDTLYASVVRLRITFDSHAEYIENTSTVAGFFLDKKISYGDILQVFFYPFFWFF